MSRIRYQFQEKNETIELKIGKKNFGKELWRRKLRKLSQRCQISLVIVYGDRLTEGRSNLF